MKSSEGPQASGREAPSEEPSVLHVLLVEDNKHDARVAVRAFANSDPPCDLTHCVRAEQAVELLDAPEASFDVVVSDLQLPGMHGLDFCKKVVSDNPNQATVILTGSGSENMAVEALKAGVDDYIIKDPEGNYAQMLPLVITQVARQRRERVARRRAEAELNSERALSDAAMACLPGIFYVYNEHGKFMRWNSNLETVSGHSGDEISRMLPEDFFPQHERIRVKEAIQEVFSKGSFSVEADFLSKDGSTTPFFFTGARFEVDGAPCLAGLGIDITERKRISTERDQLIHNMGERIKELQCMYGVSNSIQRRASLEEILQDVAELIPSGWHYPEITRSKVVFDGKEYVSEPFDETEWKQSSDIVLDGKPRGAVEVYYLETRPELDEGPFLAEERSLINGIAGTVSEAAERKQAGVELQKSVQKLERLANNLIDAFLYRHDPDGVFDYVSSSVTRILGYEPQEFLEHFSEFTTDHPKNREALKHTALSIRGFQQPPYEVEVRAKDGAPRWFAVAEVPVRDERGEVVAVEGVAHDITERKKAEDALWEKAFMLESASSAIAAADLNGNMTYANPAFLHAWGIECLDEVRGRPFPEFWDVSAQLDSIMDALLGAGPGQWVGDLKAKKEDGSLFDMRVSAATVVDNEGKPIALMSTSIDITERKRTEREREITIALLEVLNEKSDLRGLMQATLRFMKKLADCEAVGIRLRDGDDFPYYETRGFSDEFVEAERRLCVTDLNGQIARDDVGNPVLECMCGNIICGRVDPSKPFFTDYGSFVSNCTTELLASTTDEDRQARTRNRCNGEGYESVALIRLHAGGETFGLMQFNDRKKGCFPRDFVEQAEQLAKSVAIALAQRQAEEALAKERGILDQIIELNPYSISMYDAEGHYERSNKAHLELFRAPPPPPDYSIFSDPILVKSGLSKELDRLRAGEVIRIPDTWYNAHHASPLAEDHPVCVRAVCFPLLNRAAEVVHMVAVHEDITDRRLAEEELKNSRSFLDSVISQSPYPTWISDTNGTMIKVNAALLKALNVSEDQLLGKYNVFEDLQVEEQGILPKIRDVLENGRTVEYELAWTGMGTNDPRLREAHTVHCEGTIFPISNQEGTITNAVITYKDVSDRKKAEEDLRESEKNLKEAQRVAHVGFWDLNVVTEELSWSDETYRIFGCSPQEFVPAFEAFASALHPEDRERVLQSTDAALSGSADYDIEFRLVRSDGEIGWVHCQGEVTRDAQGNPLRFFGTQTDITERKQAEEEHSRLETQMQQTQKLESLGVMAGGIAHDFNNILYAILGNADIALDEMPAEAVGRDNLQEIQTAARRASGLTDQMLAYSGKGALVIERIDLPGLVREMAHLLEVSHTKKAIVKYRFEENLPAVEGDASQLRQVVMNLITNASEAIGEEGGVITVVMGVTEVTGEYLASTYANDELPGGHYVCLEVSDTGCGMDDEARRRVFEPFFTTKFTGRGLGMAAVLGIIRAHKGAIDIRSELDHGTTMKVLFPALSEPAKPASEEAPRKEDGRGSGTVLVVDDERQVRLLQQRMLERKGFTVLTAEDGRQATEVLREHRDDIVCVLLDLTMPHMGGEETFVELRKIRADVPVVLVSGYSEEQLMERVGDLGFAGFLKKPVRSGALLEMVRAVVSHEEDL